MIAITIIVASAIVYRAQLFAAEQLPAYLSTRLSEALGRPVRVGTVRLWPPGAFSVRNPRVLPPEGETEPPLAAERARVYLSWWDLIAHRRLRLRGLHLDRARVRGEVSLQQSENVQTDAAEALRALSRIGLRQIGVHDTTVHLTTVQSPEGLDTVSLAGLDLVADLRGETFRLRGRADRWSGGGFEASELSLRGEGDGKGLRITRSGATFSGGRLHARGTYVARGGSAALQVRVRNMPLQTLAPQLGIPEEWAVNGNVSGTVEVDAVSGRLQRVDGGVSIARGFIQRSQAVLPWTQARARVQWRPERVDLTQIEIEGDGLNLTGDAGIGGKPYEAFATRPFTASGKVRASSAKTVASLAELLAFSDPVPGNWSVAGATLDFQARGMVGKLAEATARGRFQASDLRLPTPGSPALLRINQVSGDVERTGTHLEVRNIRATADGLTARGDLVVTPERENTPGTFSTQGNVELTHLTTLRRQVPNARFWQWIAPALPNSRGEVRFQAKGATAAPQRLTGSGTFRFRNFVANLPSGVGTERWQAPIHLVEGRVYMAGEKLSLKGVQLRSDLFQGTAEASVTNLAREANVTGAVHLISERWQELPLLSGRVPKSLSGGVLRVDARLPASPTPRNRQVTGKATLEGARYRLDFAGTSRAIPLETASASFEFRGNRVVVPAYAVRSTYFSTTGSGSAVGTDANRWLLRGNGRISAPDAGMLLRWWTDNRWLQGGRLEARYQVEAPSDRPADLTLRGNVRLVDALPRLPETALPFRDEEARIQNLTGAFTYRHGVTSFQDLLWTAPRFTARANGSFARGVLESRFRLSTGQWREIAPELASTLPIAGGLLTVEGSTRGALSRLAQSPVTGVIRLTGARLSSNRNASAPVDGGVVDLRANVRGTLNTLAGSDVEGAFSVRNVQLPPLRKNAETVRVHGITGAFRRRGSTVMLSNLEANAPGVKLTGSGELQGVGTGKASHAFRFAASGSSLASVLPAVTPLPGTAVGGEFRGSLRLTGNASQRLASLQGEAEVRNLKWTPPGQEIPLEVRSMSARVSRTGSEAVIDRARLNLVGGTASLTGTFKDLGTQQGERHSVRVTWRFENASAWATRFLPVPGWFTGGVFSGRATIDGTAADPARAASGEFTVTDAGFMPPKQFLGGPVRPIQVHSAGSPFTRSGGKTTLTALVLRTSVGNASGTVSADDRGNAVLRARGDIEKLEALVDLWPGFKDRIRGGSGRLDLDLKGPLQAPRRMAGSIHIAGRNGALTVENVDELYAVHPFEEISLALNLRSDGSVRISGAKLRGPKANLDGKGLIQADNRLHVEGRAWFTEAFTKKLIKPKFLWPLARLIGKRQIKSAFELDGTLREARLDLGITDSLLWGPVIKKRVPEPLRKIATGDAPIWSVSYPPERPVALAR